VLVSILQVRLSSVRNAEVASGAKLVTLVHFAVAPQSVKEARPGNTAALRTTRQQVCEAQPRRQLEFRRVHRMQATDSQHSEPPGPQEQE